MRGAKQKKMFEISDLRREILHLRSVCLSSRGTLIFSCILRLGLFLGVQNFKFQYIFFQKTAYFFFFGGGGGGGGMKILWICFGSSQNWTIQCILGSYLVKLQNGGYFLGC